MGKHEDPRAAEAAFCDTYTDCNYMNGTCDSLAEAELSVAAAHT